PAWARRSIHCDEFLAQRIARFKVPRYLSISHSPLPRTASGKILKRELQAMAINSVAG
ncbi:MAG: hypothetical protein HC809_05875, partial [Gammaproteobacteria bacterium]|nr:hypothetical protein [Gammaproteobacteria bacterium]